MTWSYTPVVTNVDKVRFLIGDTNIDDQLLSNEEIAYLLTVWVDIEITASIACETIAAKFSREAAMKKVGDLQLNLSNRAKAYRDMAVTIRSTSAKLLQVYAGGISEGDKEYLDQDTDKVKPAFTRGLMKKKQPDLDQSDDYI